MKNEINTVLENMTATTPERSDYTGEDGLLYCGKCHKPKEAYFPEGKALLGLTATRQSVTARGHSGLSVKPPSISADTLTPWRN